MPKLDLHETSKTGEMTGATPEELLRLAQTAWIDYHRRTAGGEIESEKHEKGSENAFDRLVDQLSLLLDLEREDIISAAFTRAHASGADDVANELKIACEIAASVCELDDHLSDSGPRSAFLYAIPVCLYGPEDLPTQIPSAKLREVIQESIAQFGLFEGNAEVNVSDRLLTLEELEMLSYGAVRQITKELANGGDVLVPTGLVAGSNVESGTLQPRAHLRYLVLTVTQDEEYDPDEEAESSVDDGREEAWLDYLQALLEQNLKLDPAIGFLTVGFPDEFFDAHYSGRVERSNSELLAYLRDFAQTAPQGKAQYGAVIAPFGDKGVAEEVRIALVDFTKGELCGGFRYPIHRAEDTAEALNSCGQIARDFGFTPVKIYAELQNDEGVPEGQTGFLLHHPTASMLPEVPFPTSNMLH